MPSGLSQSGPPLYRVHSKATKEKGDCGSDAGEASPMTMTLCPPCTPILNDMDTCRQRLWKKAFIGVVVSTLPMNWNTRPPGPSHPLPGLPPPPIPISRTLGMEDNVGWGPRPCLRYSHCPLPPCPCSALVPPKLWVMWFRVGVYRGSPGSQSW